MDILPMIDMSLSPEKAQEMCLPCAADAPKYPYGLSISLCGDQLDKLGVDYNDLSVDDMVHLHAMAVITSKSKNETQSGNDPYRVELQITHLSGENEDDENDEAEDKMSSSKIISKLYK